MTVNGTNMEISDQLEGRRLQFLVLGAEPLSPDATLGPITLRIVGKHQSIRTSNIIYCYHIGYCMILKQNLAISAHVSFIGGVYYSRMEHIDWLITIVVIKVNMH